VSRRGILAIALTPGERDLLAKALRAHRTEALRMKAELLQMLEQAAPAGLVPGLGKEEPKS
jgi:hypothetical protein